MAFTRGEVARMVDLSAVRAETTEAEVRALADVAVRYGCLCATTLPSHTPLLVELLAAAPGVRVSGNVGFPSGGVTTGTKVCEARELLRMGCTELDVVINLGWLRSMRDAQVLEDLRSVVEAAGGVVVKAILECHYLSRDEIRRACVLCVEAGAAYVKTGTGWTPTGATSQNVTLIKSCVGERVGIKAAGGIRSLETLAELYRCGARRFGIGYRWAASILEQCADA